LYVQDVGSRGDHWDRVETLEKLGEGDERDLRPLFDALTDEQGCWHTKGAAIESLVKLRPPGTGPAILRMLVREREPSIRQAAIEALAELGERKSVRLLQRLAREDPSAEVRAAAVRAVATLRNA
jgi:HEAT repeat protein